MTRSIFPVIFLLLFTGMASAQGDLLLTNAIVIDVETGVALDEPRDILIRGERIERIGPAGGVPAAGARRFDAAGRYVIPGLWDMHTHPDDPEVWWLEPTRAYRDALLPQFVVFGVTGTRDMAGDLALVNDWRRRIRNGELTGPEIIAGGPLLDGPEAMWDGSVSIADTARVKPVVDSLIAAGVDFLKIYSGLPREIFFALAGYARSLGFPMAGHIPNDVTTLEGARAGLDCQEHLLNIPLECSAAEELVRQGEVDYSSARNGIDRYVIRYNLLLDQFDEAKAAALCREYARLGTWHTPTLSMWYKNAYYEEEVGRDSALFRYLPPHLQKYWQPDTNVHLRYRDHPGFVAVKRRLVDHYLTITGLMHRAGVRLLAGTDIGANPLCWPGVGVHNELSLFVRAGLSPAEALRTATVNPADFLGLRADFGTVSPGKIADLVILNANPLTDIENVRDIEAVVRRGRLLDRQERERVLENVKF